MDVEAASRRVLLVDGDIRLSAALAGFLRGRGYRVERVGTVRDALAHQRPDVVLLERNLPDGDGLAACRRLRRDNDGGIIIVAARATAQDRVAGLRAGADDYVAKPYELPELHARLDAVLRRCRPVTPRRLSVGSLVVDLDRDEARIGAEPVPLTAKEFHLLVVLARSADEPVARAHLAEQVWQRARLGRSRTLDVHISTLRSKIGHAAHG